MFVLVTPGIAFITQLAMKLIKRFYVAVGVLNNRSQMTSKFGKNKNVVLEEWSVISYCTDPRRWSRRLCVCPPTDDEMRVGFSLSYKSQYCYNFLVPRADTSPPPPTSRQFGGNTKLLSDERASNLFIKPLK